MKIEVKLKLSNNNVVFLPLPTIRKQLLGMIISVLEKYGIAISQEKKYNSTEYKMVCYVLDEKDVQELISFITNTDYPYKSYLLHKLTDVLEKSL